MIFDCFRKKPKVTKRRKQLFNVGIVVGHTPHSVGARNYLGEAEFFFNQRIAKKVEFKLVELGVTSSIVYRDYKKPYDLQCTQVAEACVAANIKFTVNLHFNTFKESVLGCETLSLLPFNLLLSNFSNTFLNILSHKYQFKNRGNKILTNKHRGYRMLFRLREEGIDSVIVEPCFANVRTKESAFIFENEDAYVDVIVESLVRTCCEG